MYTRTEIILYSREQALNQLKITLVVQCLDELNDKQLFPQLGSMIFFMAWVFDDQLSTTNNNCWSKTCEWLCKFNKIDGVY